MHLVQTYENADHPPQIDNDLHSTQDDGSEGEMIADILRPLPGATPTEPAQDHSRQP
jgi:hypothetical protein